MVNLGLDFGSTYTMVSIFENGEPKTVQPNNLTFNYPAIVCYDEGKKKYFFGTSAREKLGKRGVVGFRGFKMLLNHQMSEEKLRERNYTGENTPEHITELFLHYVISNTLKKLNEDKVDLLVIGAPECWFQSLQTIDARGTLRDICLGFSDIVCRVELRSEPTDAAAFCVWNYEKKNGQNFDGSILVVDYGGGTLDTALVSVAHTGDKIQIKPEMLRLSKFPRRRWKPTPILTRRSRALRTCLFPTPISLTKSLRITRRCPISSARRALPRCCLRERKFPLTSDR